MRCAISLARVLLEPTLCSGQIYSNLCPLYRSISLVSFTWTGGFCATDRTAPARQRCNRFNPASLSQRSKRDETQHLTPTPAESYPPISLAPVHSRLAPVTDTTAKFSDVSSTTTSFMARSARTVSTRRVLVRQSYYWPDQQLNIWIFVMLATGGVLIGVFAAFIVVQGQLGNLGIPWIMPFGIATGSLTIVFLWAMLILIYQRRLLPGVVMIGSFILLVLYITGIIETAIQLFGPDGNINGNCQMYVSNRPSTDLSIYTLAWLEQNSICQSWDAVFAFWIVGAVFLTWMIILGSQVARGAYGDPV
ncbi:Hypothetical protein R9X50_00723700 [Acrodontium crateriforme]|uniref:Uncharacterized protein n=1 Tax=Acrodontium crateriforme TaxID=150365 RepID=A0AAQ3M9E3_9PEZI|nr:Hypothetical protein R9X50_00723700 [Acrodontium crateriforme]